MKQIKLIAFTVMLFSSVLFTSCSPEESSDTNDGVSLGNYWPLAVNNVWNLNRDGAATLPMKITGTNVFGGDTYYKFSENNIYELETWAAKKGGSYYLRTGELNINDNGIVIKMEAYEMPIFKDNLAVNEMWTGTTSSNVSYSIDGKETTSYKLTIKYTGKILEKDGTVTVNNKTYSNVIKMSLKQELVVQNNTSVTESVYWYAKDVGPVKSIVTSDGITVVNEVISYTLSN